MMELEGFCAQIGFEAGRSDSREDLREWVASKVRKGRGKMNFK